MQERQGGGRLPSSLKALPLASGMWWEGDVPGADRGEVSCSVSACAPRLASSAAPSV